MFIHMVRHGNSAPCDIFISHLATSPYRTLPPPTIAQCDSKSSFPSTKIMSAVARRGHSHLSRQPPLHGKASLQGNATLMTRATRFHAKKDEPISIGLKCICQSIRIKHFNLIEINRVQGTNIQKKYPYTCFTPLPIIYYYFTDPFLRRNS